MRVLYGGSTGEIEEEEGEECKYVGMAECGWGCRTIVEEEEEEEEGSEGL